ncbi:hypothetical protein [Pseudomonas shirazensis]|uniref:hypothetical protein n=1 Tax=Pseudomonas shirazensis TaxID=2745494 RepID=UPI003D2CA2FD
MNITLNTEKSDPVSVIEALAETMSYDQLDNALVALGNQKAHLYMCSYHLMNYRVFKPGKYDQCDPKDFRIRVSDALLRRSSSWSEEVIDSLGRLLKLGIIRFHDLSMLPKEELLAFAHQEQELILYMNSPE